MPAALKADAIIQIGDVETENEKPLNQKNKAKSTES